MATNLFLGLARGDSLLTEPVTGAASNGTSSDVEVRIQTNNGVSNTNITRSEAVLLLQQIISFIESGGQGPGSGSGLPAF